MKMISRRKTFFLYLWLAVGSAMGYSNKPDNQGVEFYVAFGENNPNSLSLELFITTSLNQTITVNVTAPLASSVYAGETVTVSKGQVRIVQIPKDIRMTGSSVQSRGIYITASDEIIVYAVNKEHYSSDSFLVIPADVLGTDYFVPAWPRNTAVSGRQEPAQIGVVATENSTSVNFTMPSHSFSCSYNGQTYSSGDSLTVSLDRCQTFQLQCDEDLTGARVTSDKPIGIVSGNKRTELLSTSSSRSSDHIEEMIPSVPTLGRRFLTAPLSERSAGDVFRIIGTVQGTTLTVQGTTSGNNTYTLNAGEFQQLLVSSNDYLYIEATKAVLVVQYSKSASADSAQTDPFMMLLPPLEQFDSYYTLATVEGVSAAFRNYINVIIKMDQLSGLYLDGAPVAPGDVATNWTQISNTQYAAVILSVSPGTHTLYHQSPIEVFSAFAYGHVQYESYGYPGGCRLAPIGDYCSLTTSVAGDGLDNDCDGFLDEELLNSIDDDGDGLVDEDVAFASNPDQASFVAAADAQTTSTTTTTSTAVIPTTSSTHVAVTTSTESSLLAGNSAARNGRDLTTTEIISISVGSVVAAALVAGCLSLFIFGKYRRYKRKKEEEEEKAKLAKNTSETSLRSNRVSPEPQSGKNSRLSTSDIDVGVPESPGNSPRDGPFLSLPPAFPGKAWSTGYARVGEPTHIKGHETPDKKSKSMVPGQKRPAVNPNLNIIDF
ncbi:IgGFc-binding protein [Lingula anatina]|uniref:IgGFc-binding protein n=1 Tax=Lingula anatina TaxID=7574 RepID=A0A1S3JYD5_LINAN|nr:IgGFc-binding protein [Lingula anatina]XP_013415052.1 IgGFc-binding protein [Lingula anatina]|eukprot:XP_013415051.1 IgGFc-binding protein [Lingula anatina]